MRRRSTIQSFDWAFRGILHALRTQRHMRWHVVIGTAAIVLALLLRLTKAEILILLGTVTLVLVAEMFNTAIEAAIDLYTKEYHPLAAAAKNIAAGAVLLTAVNALVVGYVIFVPSLESLLPPVLDRAVKSPPYMTLAALLLVVTAVIVLKTARRRGSVMQGGMPSGHTAVAFALATSVVYLTRRQPTAAVLAVLLASLVAESRLESRIHTVAEVLAGAALGVLLTTLVFQLLYRYA
ncbi:MAG: diacylglycerol kinase [Patescibacteria group bacterium]